MANRGNTGQRYKMTKLVDVVIVDGKILSKYACGHNHYYAPKSQEDLERTTAWWRSQIDTRFRCNDCRKD